MIETSCRTCKFHRSTQTGTEDLDGEIIPIYEHRCELSGKAITVLDFSCGLWRNGDEN